MGINAVLYKDIYVSEREGGFLIHIHCIHICLLAVKLIRGETTVPSFDRRPWLNRAIQRATLISCSMTFQLVTHYSVSWPTDHLIVTYIAYYYVAVVWFCVFGLCTWKVATSNPLFGRMISLLSP